VRYCGADCQRAHWPEHRKGCAAGGQQGQQGARCSAASALARIHQPRSLACIVQDVTPARCSRAAVPGAGEVGSGSPLPNWGKIHRHRPTTQSQLQRRTSPPSPPTAATPLAAAPPRAPQAAAHPPPRPPRSWWLGRSTWTSRCRCTACPRAARPPARAPPRPPSQSAARAPTRPPPRPGWPGARAAGPAWSAALVRARSLLPAWRQPPRCRAGVAAVQAARPGLRRAGLEVQPPQPALAAALATAELLLGLCWGARPAAAAPGAAGDDAYAKALEAELVANGVDVSGSARA
jgi:hypothetical protein